MKKKMKKKNHHQIKVGLLDKAPRRPAPTPKMLHQILRNATNAKFKVEEQSQKRQAFSTKDRSQVAGQSPEKASPGTQDVASDLEECQKCNVQKTSLEPTGPKNRLERRTSQAKKHGVQKEESQIRPSKGYLNTNEGCNSVKKKGIGSNLKCPRQALGVADEIHTSAESKKGREELWSPLPLTKRHGVLLGDPPDSPEEPIA
ncbi:hypothetical protein Taro_037561 [Colocasia esculenta]|uniref:Uncharacterized protein n=1 Tax=Colocasia esculenta TaxID=4460 RepID=A0A843W5Z6_COLES|nr:hypothetical protein [Colocasia esculenta]